MNHDYDFHFNVILKLECLKIAVYFKGNFQVLLVSISMTSLISLCSLDGHGLVVALIHILRAFHRSHKLCITMQGIFRWASYNYKGSSQVLKAGQASKQEEHTSLKQIGNVCTTKLK